MVVEFGDTNRGDGARHDACTQARCRILTAGVVGSADGEQISGCGQGHAHALVGLPARGSDDLGLLAPDAARLDEHKARALACNETRGKFFVSKQLA